MRRSEKIRSQEKRYHNLQAYRNRIEELKRRIESERKRRRRLWLLFLLLLLQLEQLRIRRFTWSPPTIHFPPEPSEPGAERSGVKPEPTPTMDFDPESCSLEYRPGCSRKVWQELAQRKGIKVSTTKALIQQWENDPTRPLYPQRYQDWDMRPNLPQLMVEMRQPYWRAGAFAAIKLQSPPEVQNYLDEAYALEPADIRQCYSEWTTDVIANFRSAALRWEARKQREAFEMRRDLRMDEQGPSFTG